jgi:hypothetical protein
MNGDQLANKSKVMLSAATSLSDRILRFEEYLCSISSKVEARVPVTALEPGIQLCFTKHGGKWALILDYKSGSVHSAMLPLGNLFGRSALPMKLTDASMQAKIAAVAAFPALVAAIEEGLARRTAEIEAAHRVLDQIELARRREESKSIYDAAVRALVAPTNPRKEGA